MQKHQISTLFILTLIAVLAGGSYAWLQANYPHEPAQIKGNWPNIASVDEVFGTVAEPPKTTGDDYGLQGEPVLEDTAAPGGAAAADAAESYVYEDDGASAYADEAYAADSYDEADYDADYESGYETRDESAAAGAGAAVTSDDGGPTAYADPYAGTAQAQESDDDYGSDDTQSDDIWAEEPEEGELPVSRGPSQAGQLAHDNDEPPARRADTPRSHVEPIPVPRGEAPPAVDAIHQWWPNASAVHAGRFMLVYAGASKQPGHVALLFKTQPALDSLNQHVRVLDENGHVVSGRWQASPDNARLVLFKAPPGHRYTIVVPAEVVDSRGRSLGVTLSGPVYLR